MRGFDSAAVEAVVRTAVGTRVTAAGGITRATEVAELDRIGADAQVGMALYTGKLSLGDAVAAPLTKPLPDDVWPTVVCDEAGRTLGLVEHKGIAGARRGRTAWDLLVPLAPIAVAQRRDVGERAAARARGSGLRSRRAALHGAPGWRRILSPQSPLMLEPLSSIWPISSARSRTGWLGPSRDQEPRSCWLTPRCLRRNCAKKQRNWRGRSRRTTSCVRRRTCSTWRSWRLVRGGRNVGRCARRAGAPPWGRQPATDG